MAIQSFMDFKFCHFENRIFVYLRGFFLPVYTVALEVVYYSACALCEIGIWRRHREKKGAFLAALQSLLKKGLSQDKAQLGQQETRTF